MWPFNTKKSLAGSQILQGFTDCHCHLLPGVDDGFQDSNDTFHMLRMMEDAGTCQLWFTPHIMEDMPNTTEDLRARFSEIKSQYTGKIQLHLAAEYMLDTLFEKRLKADDLLLHADGNTLLVETSYTNPPFNMEQLLNAIRKCGITPILAHPERYVYMDKSDYLRHKENPIRFQLNLSSLAGAYGSHVKAKAEMLLSLGLYDCVGTDTHSIRSWQYAMSLKTLSKSTLQKLATLLGNA